MKKFLIIFIAFIAVVVIGLTLLIKFYVTPERVKAFVIPTAEKSLNRKVEIGDISIGLVKGIGLSDFTIKEADRQSDFVRFKEFVLKFKLLPLLSKNLIIDEMRLDSPVVNVVRSKDGTFNFEDMGPQKEVEKAVDEKAAEEAAGLPVSLLVNRIAVKDAQFSLSDLMNELPDVKSAADINISIKSLDGSNLATEGSIDIRVDELVMKKPEKRSVKDIAAALTYALNINLETLDLRIGRGDLKFQGIPASVTGDVKKVKTSPEVNLAVNLPKVNTAELQKLAAQFADLKGLTLSGSLSADMNVSGEVEKMETLKAKGSVLLDQVGITLDQLNALLDGKVTFDEKVMNIDLKSTIDKNSADIKGSVKNYFKNQDITLNVYAQKLALDEVIPAGAPVQKPPAEKEKAPAGTAPSKEAEPLDLKLTARGEVKVDEATYKNMAMTDFVMQYVFKNNRLEIPSLTAKAGKGTLNLNSLVDLSKQGYAYSVSTNIDSLHAEEFVNAFFPKAKDTVFGILTTNLTMNGAGTTPDRIKKNLAGGGDFSIQGGRLTGAEITKGLSRFIAIDELKTINLKEAKGTVKIQNGIARLDSLFSSDDLAMDPKGNIGLNETLDLAFDLKLSPKLTDKAMSSKIAQYIKSESGWGTVPLIVSGTFADPKYTVDVKKAGKQVIEKEVDKALDKFLDKQDEETKKELAPVKDMLKGIFK